MPDPVDPQVNQALRLGWSVAELRGRTWPHGPRTDGRDVPEQPEHVLPLRSQRDNGVATAETRAALTLLAAELGVRDPDGRDLEDDLAWIAAAGVGVPGAAGEALWVANGGHLAYWDGAIQTNLGGRDEQLANAYLLGRGLGECYWALGPRDLWRDADPGTRGDSPTYLLGADRRSELTRMLGRLPPGAVNALTGPAVSGSLAAWGEVVADRDWLLVDDLAESLYDQSRSWYQLVVLRQDPTTLVPPYAKLSGLRGAGRALRQFGPQTGLAVVALGLLTAFFGLLGRDFPGVASSLLATSGVSAFAVAGLLARGQSAAQMLTTRLRQDAYTDLLAVSLTRLPERPDDDQLSVRKARRAVESAVRGRDLTPATPPS
ncbi:hypothetical protein [Nocardioides sp.]|uniref:hypothetical protein n=1 Tax=Nocardioides sp. TaxID=35761 RepID=UPI0027193960|nr:hypothetical protein [Nocardioides sp.]MDO9454872.1 hypothetical protein [Nocardioides sp.]